MHKQIQIELNDLHAGVVVGEGWVAADVEAGDDGERQRAQELRRHGRHQRAAAPRHAARGAGQLRGAGHVARRQLQQPQRGHESG